MDYYIHDSHTLVYNVINKQEKLFSLMNLKCIILLLTCLVNFYALILLNKILKLITRSLLKGLFSFHANQKQADIYRFIVKFECYSLCFRYLNYIIFWYSAKYYYVDFSEMWFCLSYYITLMSMYARCYIIHYVCFSNVH